MEGSPSPRDQLAAITAFAPRVLRSAWLAGVVLALGLAATAAWAVLTKRQYRSEALLAYERGVQTGTAPGEGESGRQISARLQEMVTSRQRLEALVGKMKLYPAVVEQRNLAEAVEEMRRHLAFVPREGDTYRVTFDAESRELSQRVLENLLKGVMDEDRTRRLREAEDARKFLDAERKRADDDLKVKEADLSEFLTKHPQLASEVGGTATPGVIARADHPAASSAGEIIGLEMQIAHLEEQLAAAGQRVPGPGSHGDPSLVAARQRAEAALTAAQHDLAEKQAHFTNEHPDVKAAFRRVTEAENALRRAEQAVVASKDAPAAVVPAVEHQDDDNGTGSLKRALADARAQLAVLRGHSTPSHADLPRSPTAMVALDADWTRLNRDVTEARERHAQLESRQFQAQFLATLVSGGQGGRLVIVDPPFVPLRPVAGTRSKIALVGGAAAVMAALLAAILLAVFDDRLYGSRDIEQVVREAFVVVIPKLTEKGG